MHTIYMIEYHDKKAHRWVFIPAIFHSKPEVNRVIKKLLDKGIANRTHVETKKAKIPDFMKS